MSKAVFCIVNDRAKAESIVGDLRSAGFSGNDISALFPDKDGSRDFAHEKNTKAPEGAATGATAGGITGTLVGLGMPELEAKQYDEKIRGGNILLSVHTEDSAEQKKAKDIFERHHADDISSGGEAGVRKSA